MALRHAVWRVLEVVAVEMDADELDAWAKASMPDPWIDAPFDVVLQHVGGACTDWASGKVVARCRPWRHYPHRIWHVYPPSGRWPQCSCCGEPVPCRAELQDREVSAGLQRVERLASRQPGHCWGCGEPLTARQKKIGYPGDNVDFPGGIEVWFHLRRTCGYSARQYELRWLTADPTRARVLTWPMCPGVLVVHGDASSECEGTSAPGCAGHLTHDHQVIRACDGSRGRVCWRGCAQEGHPGTRCTDRPPRVG